MKKTNKTWHYLNRPELVKAITNAMTLSDLDKLYTYFILNSPGIGNRAAMEEYDEAMAMVYRAEKLARFRHQREERARDTAATLLGACDITKLKGVA